MDEGKFKKYLGNIFANGSVMLSLALGHDLGIFEFLCSVTTPLSLKEIATKLHLKERYLLEWLSSMVAADIIHQDKTTRLYIVPESHRSSLTSHVAYAGIIDLMPRRTDLIKKCFKKDGPWGISFQESPEWFEWFVDFKGKTSNSTITEEIIPCLAKISGLLHKLDTGIQVLDLGCGTGNYVIALASRFPNSIFTALDYSSDALRLAREIQKQKGVSNVDFVEGNAQKLPEEWSEKFDMIFMKNVLHDLPDPFRTIEEVHRVLTKDGSYCLFEGGFSSDPTNNTGSMEASMNYALSIYICLASSLSEPPHVGYGAMWGEEKIEKALTQHFNISKISFTDLYGPEYLFHCVKK